jgi:acyl carrier protein
MVPSAFVTLEALPITSSGKVDHRALPAPEGDRPDLDQEFVAPRTETEAILADEIFGKILGLDEVGAQDSFFELGGNSLQATQLVTRIRTRFGVQLPLRSIFESPTVTSLAGVIDRERKPVEKLADEEERLLREIEEMSEEEAERLLVHEGKVGAG